MPTPAPVLFPCLPLRRDHKKTVEMLCMPDGVPDGGPWCICGAGAILRLKKGCPEQCDDMPWACPFGSQSRCTPTS